MSLPLSKRAGAILIATWLAACVSLTDESDGLGYAERMARIASASRWTLRGRISVDTGEDAFQGRFNWRQNDDEMRLVIRGPLGAGAVEIRGARDALTVRARGETWELRDPETELSELLGWWMPVESLRYWLLGTPDQRFAQTSTVDESGLLTTLEQRAWELEYLRYGLADDVLIPRRIELVHEPLALDVTIDDWRRSESDRDP